MRTRTVYRPGLLPTPPTEAIQKHRTSSGILLSLIRLHATSPLVCLSLSTRILSMNTPIGLIPVLKGALINSHEKGKTRNAWLCHEKAVHIQSEAFDRTWGCGYVSVLLHECLTDSQPSYRNFLMVCASLMVQIKQPMYFPLLDHPYPPGVRHLQQLIEEAWSAGAGALSLATHPLTALHRI